MLGALSHPTRFAIIKALDDYGKLTIEEIKEKVGDRRTVLIKKYLYILEEAYLVKSRPEVEVIIGPQGKKTIRTRTFYYITIRGQKLSKGLLGCGLY